MLVRSFPFPFCFYFYFKGFDFKILTFHIFSSKSSSQRSPSSLQLQQTINVNPDPSNIVKLNVRGSLKMWIGKEKLLAEKSSIFSNLLDGKLPDFNVYLNEEKEVLLDCDPKAFRIIVE